VPQNPLLVQPQAATTVAWGATEKPIGCVYQPELARHSTPERV
jgi:hypothetical protein